METHPYSPDGREDWNPRPRGEADAATWASEGRPHRQGGVACDTQWQVDAAASASGCARLRPVAVGRWSLDPQR